MATRHEGEDDLVVTPPPTSVAGIPAVVEALRQAVGQMGPVRATRTLLRVNQVGGFDCPGCAWPDPEHRHTAEFCENGAKAVAEEATTARVDAGFFADHTIADLAGRTDFWLGQQGRISRPMVRRHGAEHYVPVSWDDAFDLIAHRLAGLDDPDRAVFYTSGRTSNEAAFLFQLLVRSLGTNNLPDCSNLCHESSGAALGPTIGIGKGTVTLEDVESADLLLICGQNPGTNHPRMLSSLEKAKQRGATVVVVNPLPEAGLITFKNPQTLRGTVGKGTRLGDLFCQIRLGGDQAFFAGLGKVVLDRAQSRPSVLDQELITTSTDGFEAWRHHLEGFSWDEIEAATGLSRRLIEQVGDLVVEKGSVTTCWAMGLTQHKGSVPTIREIVNLHLATGQIGRPGAGLCPVRGHSNVQGDRTMGIFEKPWPWLLDALEAEFGITAPRDDGFDVVEAIRAMDRGEVEVFMGMGGNFVRAAPDTALTAHALGRVPFAVHVSTKLNASQFTVGDTALILPMLGRTERDLQSTGAQQVTVEDSMGMVHASRGRLAPAGDLRSEVAVVCQLGRRLVPSLPWQDWQDDYGLVRERIARVIPGFEDFNARIQRPGGFALPNPPRDSRSFPTADGLAHFTVNDLQMIACPEGRLILQTVRSHDQYNTTIYGLDDCYRGIRNGRRVVFVSPVDLAELGLADAEVVDLVSEWRGVDGALQERRAEAFRIVSHDIAKGCAAAYFPETNVLVPLDHTAEVSNTPASKSVIIRLEPRAGTPWVG